MKNKTVAAWTLALIVATTGAVAMAGKDRDDEKKPSYHSSIQVPQGVKGKAALQKLAKISSADAARIAQGAVAGKVVEISLDNEDGNLVYDVEVSSGKSTSSVIVDAGNGKVLAVEADEDGEKGQKGEHEDEHKGR